MSENSIQEAKLIDTYGQFSVLRHIDRPIKAQISVILAVYNGAHTISASINSILQQTYSDFELIVINDGSSDKTEELLQTAIACDSRIIIVNQQNLGLTRSLNRGLSLARGIFVARQDADDQSFPLRFDIQLQAINTHEAFLIGSSCTITHLPTSYRDVHVHHLTPNKLFRGNPFVHSSILFRRVPNIRYCDQYRFAQDYQLYFDALALGPVLVMDHAVTMQGNSLDRISHTYGLRQRASALQARMRNIAKYPSLSALLYTARACAVLGYWGLRKILKSYCRADNIQ